MSHNYHFRRPAPDSDLRPDPGLRSSSDRHHTSPAHDFYRLPQDPSSSSYPSASYSQSSSSSSTRGAKWSQDSALSILSSCGLEPSDLALLAKLPEDVLTVESLPQVLKQIKQKRGTVKPFTPDPLSAPSAAAACSYPHSSTYQPAVSTVPTDGDDAYRQLIQYPLDHLTASPLPPSGQERWGSPTTSLSARAKPSRPLPSAAAAAASNYMVDFHHRSQSSEYKVHQYTSPGPSQGFQQRPGPSGFDKMGRTTVPGFSHDYHNRPGLPQFGKTGRDTASVSSYNQASFHSGGSGQHSHFSHPTAPSPNPTHPQTYGGRSVPLPRASSQADAPMPTKKEALDFHGTSPKMFPYSCSLCDITVMSEKVWAKHINGTNHADGQLSLLQRFPQWDCRMETITKQSSPSEKGKNENVPDSPSQPANQNSTSQTKSKADKKIPDKGKVVCVKFPAQALDETQLRKMVEPFGEIVKIVLFPSLAFVELGSISQANDLVKFHSICPPTVNGSQVQFEIAATFSFLQSSQVVSFTPAPTGQCGRADLISIIKRFGWPLYTLFLPSMVFVEMKNANDAKKLVEYYLSNTLKINSDIIKVSYSGEYKSLMHVPLAKKFEEEITQEVRSTSQEKEEKRKRSRTRSRSREKSRKGKGTRSRSRSTERSSKGKRTRSTSRSKESSSIRKRSRSRSRSKERSRKEKRARSRTRSRSKSRGKSSRDKRSRSKSRSTEKSSKRKRNRSRSKSRSKSPEKSSKGKRSKSRSKSTERSGKGEKARSSSRSRSKSTEKSSKGKRGRSRSRSRSKSRGKSSKEKRNRSRSRSKSRGKSSRDKRSRSKSRSREKSTVPGKTEATECKTDPNPAAVIDTKPKEEAKEQPEEEVESSDEESDIEGMQVIGEDVEDMEDEEDDTVEEGNEEGKEEEQMEEAAEKDGKACLTASADSAKPDEEEKVKEAGPDDPAQQAEQEPDFPLDLENCITLDELQGEQLDDQDKGIQDDTKSPSSRVLKFSNLPRRILNDKEFLKLLRGFGTPVHGYHAPPNSGFIEMSTSSEAVRAVEELSAKPATVRNTKLVVQMSDQYETLTNGWPLKLDEDEEKRSKCRTRSSMRRQKDESNRQTEGVTSDKSPPKDDPEQLPTTDEHLDQESTFMKAPDEASASTQDLEPESNQESASQQDPDQESASKEDLEKGEANNAGQESASCGAEKKPPATRCSSKKPSKKKLGAKINESATETAQDGAENETSEDTCQATEEELASAEEKLLVKAVCSDDETPEKISVPKTNQDETLKRKETRENDSVSEETDIKSADAPEVKTGFENLQKEEGVSSGPALEESESPHQTDSTQDQSKLQNGEAQDQVQEPAVASELQHPTKPVGAEFVRPVVGYLCHLCQLIYTDEDEAKVKHCSSLTHYRKYQEKTGKDPWAS